MFLKLYRNLSVAEDNNLVENEDEESSDLVSGLHCKIVVQFEKYVDFYNALKVLSGRSLQKVTSWYLFQMFLSVFSTYNYEELQLTESCLTVRGIW